MNELLIDKWRMFGGMDELMDRLKEVRNNGGIMG